jgi:hypothetical protein
MNHVIAPSSHLWPLAPALQAIVTERNGPVNCDRFEFEDTVLRAGGLAWPLPDAEAAPLHAEIARLTAEKEALEAAEAARIAALPPEPWRVSKDTIIGRVLAEGKLPQVMASLAAQPQEDQFVWANSAWFWSNNVTLRGLCAHPAISLDADAVLAPDPYL